MIVKILNLILLLTMPFLMIGVIRKTKAFWGARYGASIFQPFYDFIKLMKKDSIFSSSTTHLFKLAPAISFACIIFASLFTPMLMGKAIINIQGGLIIFAYSLGLSKFISLLASMETASSFEGMGSSREACFTTIIEPAFFIVIASIMALSKLYTFDSLNFIIVSSGSLGILITIFAIACLFIMLIVEGARVPVDDPATHLELTMIHEVMVLDNCSQELALISYSAWAKMFLISSLIATLILPLHLTFWASLSAFIGIMILISIIIGTIESAIARLRMSHIFEFAFIMSSLALVTASLVALKLYGV